LIEWKLVLVQMLAGPGGVAASNKASGVGGVAGFYVMSDAVGVGAGDASSVAVGTAKASFVAKANSSIALPSGLRFWVLVSTLPRFPQTVGCTLSQNMRQVGRLASHTVAACPEESAITCFW